MTTLLDLIEGGGAVRHTDPESSRDAAATAPVKGQRAKVLGLLRDQEAKWGAGVVTADSLFARWPTSARGTWSTRLSGMERDGLLMSEGYRVTVNNAGPRKVRAFSLTELGRIEAGRLVHPSHGDDAA